MKFHDRMTKQSLKTFYNVSKKTDHEKKGQDVVLKADRNLFSHRMSLVFLDATGLKERT